MKKHVRNNRGVALHIEDSAAGIKAPVALFSLLQQAEPDIIRFAGGCSGMDAATKSRMLQYVVTAFGGVGGYRGVVMSGGTYEKDSAPTVCQIPIAMAEHFDCIAVSTTPRVGTLHLDSRSAGLTFSDTAALDERHHASVIVQKNASDDAEWDGDLAAYFTYMTKLRDNASWDTLVVAINGGGVTKKEIAGALLRGIPVIVINGTGRAADTFSKEFNAGTFVEFAGLLEGKTPSDVANLVHIADFAEVDTFAEGLRRFGFESSCDPEAETALLRRENVSEGEIDVPSPS